jgi:hypothetical protein
MTAADTVAAPSVGDGLTSNAALPRQVWVPAGPHRRTLTAGQVGVRGAGRGGGSLPR